MGQPLRVLLLEEGLAEAAEVVVAVRRQRAHQLLDAAAEQDVVGGALTDQGLRVVELTARRLPARELIPARVKAPRELGGLPARLRFFSLAKKNGPSKRGPGASSFGRAQGKTRVF